MSAITWAGFDNFYYFYSHEDSRDAFAIPHDLVILKELFGLEPGGYRRRNAFWTAYAIDDLIAAVNQPELSAQRDRIRRQYDAMSDQYQKSKGDNNIPLN